MKYLIVNGDDFGASRGINRGIMEAHRKGILTSASLLVNATASEEATALSRAMPALSVGLHVDIRLESFHSGTALHTWLPWLLREQFERFEYLAGRLPTHLDSHHNIHRDRRLLPYFLDLARQEDLPLREYSPIRHFPSFYGQWEGITHWEHISTANLCHMLATEIGTGITELSCHPGYVDEEFSTSYAGEREVEVRTLTDPLLRRVLQEQEIQLASFHELGALLKKGHQCP
jgi:chitin disaccharide deacetylase